MVATLYSSDWRIVPIKMGETQCDGETHQDFHEKECDKLRCLEVSLVCFCNNNYLRQCGISVYCTLGKLVEVAALSSTNVLSLNLHPNLLVCVYGASLTMQTLTLCISYSIPGNGQYTIKKMTSLVYIQNMPHEVI